MLERTYGRLFVYMDVLCHQWMVDGKTIRIIEPTTDIVEQTTVVAVMIST
jgi:hypothetical protein